MNIRTRFIHAFLCCLMALSIVGCASDTPAAEPETVPATTAEPEYTVTFQLNGGRLLSGETVQTIRKGQSAQAPDVRYGSRKLSWDCDFDTITADTTVNALWTQTELSAEELTALSQKVTVQLTIKKEDGKTTSGSGFFIDRDGQFATAYHLIDQAVSIDVTAPDGTAHPLETIVAFSPVYDVAVLKIALDTPDYLDICAEGAAAEETVYISGVGTLTEALVQNGNYLIGNGSCIQLDTVIPAEALGGPLLNKGGEAVGINCYQKIRSKKINLAVSGLMLDQMDDSVHFTLEEMQQWYDAEAALSYRPSNDDKDFFDSLVHTITTVTGRPCFASLTLSGLLQDDYVEDCIAYMYSYKPEDMEAYTAYLLSQGFVFLDTATLEDGQVQTTYINDVNNMTITYLLDEASGYLTIIPATI